MAMRHFGDSRDILHLECVRAWRFGVDQLGVRANQLLDLGANHRVVIGRLDAVAAQHVIAEPACGPIDRINHEHMIASAQYRKEGHADCSQSGGKNDGAG